MRRSYLNFLKILKIESYINNLKLEGGDECLRRPCGVNAKCRETLNGFECTCDPGCHGDPHQACICDGGEPCKDMRCGVNAACRIYKNQPQCYCPSNFPSGDPMHACEYPSVGQLFFNTNAIKFKIKTKVMFKVVKECISFSLE